MDKNYVIMPRHHGESNIKRDIAVMKLREENASLRRELEAEKVNAVPVVHGEWVHGCTNGAGTEFCYCSVCDEDALKDKYSYTEFSSYCPNCGAKMGGRQDG